MVRRLFVIACAGLAAGCASTTIVNQWQSPTDPGPAFTKLLVIGISQNASVRRIFEDAMVKALLARGVVAVPSYTLIPEDGPVGEGRLTQAIQRSGVDGVLTTRVVRVAQQMDVVPMGPAWMGPGPMGPAFWGPPWGFYGWYRGAWGPAYAYAPAVVVTDIVYAEVRLFRAHTDALVWAATTQTFAPSDAARESAAFAQVILNQLTERRII